MYGIEGKEDKEKIKIANAKTTKSLFAAVQQMLQCSALLT